MPRNRLVLAVIAAVLVTAMTACGDGELTAQVDEASTTTRPATSTPTTPPVTAPADYTCSDLTADTAAFNGRLEQVLGEQDVDADDPGFAAAAPTLVAELIADCGRAWALELAENLPGKTFKALEAIIAESAPTTTTTAPPTTTSPPVTTAGGGGSYYGPEWFSSPSGNIGCSITDSGVRCDIGDRYWSPPPQPADCPLDWGNALVVSSSGADFGCVGDTALGAPDVLPYGSSARRGSFICESRDVGMTCRDDATGHGFFVARERYELF